MSATRRILCIEDEAKLARFLQRALEEEGFVVDIECDGDRGYRRVRMADYDLLIVDVLLPGMMGDEICRKLRGQAYRLPILMLTAKNTLEDTIRGLDSGADDYLSKPFAIAEVLARVRALLRRQEVKTRTFTVGDLTLDLLSREVTRAGKQIFLSAREFSLLEFLMRHAGTLVTRAAITEHVWGMAFDPQTNVLSVYIAHLRDKIDTPGTPSLIHTVRGVGYVIG